MNYFELNCIPKTKEHAEILIVRLAELGFDSFIENEDSFKGYIQESLYNENTASEIEDLKLNFPFHYQLNLIPDQNWNQEWEKNFPPINVDDKCYIRASFHEAKPGYLHDIVINPKMSFGTGHHETTCLVISQLLKMDLEDKAVCDMGCGTSVLAILAAKMHAASVLAIDVDDWSVENSRENIDTNNVQHIVVKKGDAHLLAGNTFHVILANINRNILLRDIDKYVSALAQKGILVMSGFFETDISLIRNKAESLGMRFENSMQKNKWAMLSFFK